jgi:hypothetical protein
MNTKEMYEAMTRGYVRLVASISAKTSDERGDVPGWVLVTVMTAGLVVAIWSVADGQLKSVLSNSLRSVSQP